MTTAEVYKSDCITFLKRAKKKGIKFNLVIGSPPYEDRRTYNIGFKLAGQDWVDWMAGIIKACLAVTDGLVAFVVCGKTVKGRYSCTPELLMADLHRAGIIVRRPPLYVRWGIAGSGGKDWLANRYEPIVCCCNTETLPWSDNTACGQPPKHKPGGQMSYRNVDGERLSKLYPSSRTRNGKRDTNKRYKPPELANPGNIIDVGAAGGGQLGSKLAHENEAPYPIKIPLTLIKSFCPPGGTVYDPFSGSGTTAEAAIVTGRNFVGTDIRKSQVKLTEERIKLARSRTGFGLNK